MLKNKKNQNSSFKQVGNSEFWESQDGKASIATPLQRKDGTKGISIRTGKKTEWNKGKVVYGKSVWIDDDLDLPSWLSWFVKTIKKMYFDLFGKKLQADNEVEEYYQLKLTKLTKELAITQQKLEEAEQKSEDYQKTLELARQIRTPQKDMKNKYYEFNLIIKQSIDEKKGKEEDIKRKILENPWLLGLECSVEAKNKDIDTQTEIDLHIKTKYNQDKIFEFKSPNVSLFERKNNETSRFNISKDLAEGLSELIIYLTKTDFYSQVKLEGTYGIKKATGFIVAGFNISEKEEEMLKDLNFFLGPHIQIITYNDLQKNIEKELALIDAVNQN
jgi:hypothetical protein